MWLLSEPQTQVADGHARLRWSNLHLRPTRLGWGMVLACVLLWIMAVNYQLNVAYILLFWLVGVLFFGMMMGARQLLGWCVRIDLPTECFAGQAPQLRLSSVQDTRQTRWLWCRLGAEETGNDEREAAWQTWAVGLMGGLAQTWVLPPQPRGWLRVPPLVCAAHAPLGLLVIEASWHYAGEAVVYPAPIEHTLPQRQKTGDAESHLVALDGEDVAYLLAHNHAVSPRQIAWKQYAKSGELLDKWFDVGAEVLDAEVISYRDYPAHTGKERLAGLLCFRVLQAEQQHQRYALELPHVTIGQGVGQRERCLTALGLW